MAPLTPAPGTARFGPYELDVHCGELRKFGVRLKLGEQPLRILMLLIERPGEMVTREELRARLWSHDTFVDFDHSLNSAVQRLREALSDTADKARWIETVPRRGYRFAGSVEWSPPSDSSSGAELITANQPSGCASTEISGTFGENQRLIASLSPPGLPMRNGWPIWALITCVVVVIVGVLTALAAYRFRFSPADRYASFKPVPFTTYPGLEIAPSFSPDGNRIVFWWSGDAEHGNPAGLYVKESGNEKAVPLTEDPSCVVPAWSPDGRWIAFSRSNKDGNGIYVMPSLGGVVRKLTSTEHGCDRFSYLSWSSNSRWLAFPDSDEKVDASVNQANLYILNVETLEKRMIPSPSPNCIATWMPAFSPDGKSLAMVCETTNEIGAIFVEPSMGGSTRKVLDVQGIVHRLAWTPDSGALVYAMDGNLWRVSTFDGVPERLPVSDAFAPAIARNGDRLAYAHLRENRNIWKLELSSPVKIKYPAAKIITSTARQTGPRISPDGRHIAFESDRSGSPEIWTCDSDGSNPVQMTFFRGPQTGTVRWSPDSSRLVFDSRASGRPELYVLSAEGGTPRLIPTGTDDATDPFWSADGQWIYFATERHQAIWKVPAAGGNAAQLTASDGFLPQESGDGSRIYYARGRDRVNLWWVSPNGGASHVVDGIPSLAAGDHWAPSKSGIYFINGSDSPATLNLFDEVTRHLVHVSTLSGSLNGWGPGLNVSNDGHSVLYSELDELTGNIMLVENFH